MSTGYRLILTDHRLNVICFYALRTCHSSYVTGWRSFCIDNKSIFAYHKSKTIGYMSMYQYQDNKLMSKCHISKRTGHRPLNQYRR